MAESELMRREPDKSASQAAHIAFQFELMQVRQANPVALAYPFSKGTTILSSHQIPADIPKPTGLPNWMAPLAVRYFRAPTGWLMSAGLDRSRATVVTIGATSLRGSRSVARPRRGWRDGQGRCRSSGESALSARSLL